MIELNSELKSRVQVFQDRIYVPNTASELRPLPAEPNALQGYDPTLMIVDEVHVVTDKVWESVSLAAGKRPEALTLAISTPADNGEWGMWRLVEDGRKKRDDKLFKRIEDAAPVRCGIDGGGGEKLGHSA